MNTTQSSELTQTKGNDDAIVQGPHFIRAIIESDLASGKHQRAVTRFPPEPNGYLHIGHAKSVCLNFSMANEYDGVCHLRFDDTDPSKEDMEYVEAIQRDIRWLGFDWKDNLFFASDYFERLYQYAVQLIRTGKAYVCSLSEDEIREYRGTITEPGKLSPYRSRSIDENLNLFERMRSGDFPDGAHVLRAKIDMAATNMKMRDPPLYRIRHTQHFRQGTRWCIYPLYDFTHCLSDSIEGITHSLCTLEFENNRELYDWILDQLPVDCHPQQIEFARLNLNYTVMSKRRLLMLVKQGHVQGWDDPRMPTLAGLRRRGYTPESIRNFCERIGVAKNNSIVDLGLLEHSIRDDLNAKAPRVLGVLDPLKLTIQNYPESQSESLDAPYFPPDIGKPGQRKLPFSRVLYIERDDFREHPPKKFFRLAPGREVRLRYAYVVRCVEMVKDPVSGEVTELVCEYDPATLGAPPGDGRRIRGTLHWVSAEHALPVEVRLYDRLFSHPDPDRYDGDFVDGLNPESLRVVGALVEPSLGEAQPGERFQFERQGFFVVDSEDGDGRPVFNRIVALKDTWAKVTEARTRPGGAPTAPASPTETRTRRAPATGPSTREPATTQAPLPPRALELVQAHGLGREPARLIAASEELTAFFQSALTVNNNVELMAKWTINELLRELKGKRVSELRFDGQKFGQLIALIDSGQVSSAAAKQVLTEMSRTGTAPEEIVRQQGLQQVAGHAELEPLIQRLLASQAEKVARYRAGQVGLLGFFVGRVMRETGGKADPRLVNELVKKHLGPSS